MEKNIYSILNETNINLDNYKKEDFNDIEKRNIKANFRKSILKNKSYKSKRIAAGIGLTLTITLFSTNIGASALTRAMKIIGVEDIGSFMGIQKNIDDYKTIVNKGITNNGVTVQLDEVILDGNELTISYNVTYDKKLSEIYSEKTSEVDEAWHGFNGISINGKELNTGGGGGSRSIDDYTIQSVLTYDLGNVDSSGDLDIKLSCSPVKKDGNNKDWGFEFKTNGEQLKADTKEITIDNKFTLDNGTEVTFQKYTSNSIGQKIYSSISNFKMKPAYSIQLKGTDDLGNKVEFYESHGNENEALFKIENIDGNLNENAKALTLIPYASKLPEQGGEMSNEYKKAGEPFTIDLTQLK